MYGGRTVCFSIGAKKEGLYNDVLCVGGVNYVSVGSKLVAGYICIFFSSMPHNKLEVLGGIS